MKNIKNYKAHIIIPKQVKVEKKNGNLIFHGRLGVCFINLNVYDSIGVLALNLNEDNDKIIISSFKKSFFKCMLKQIKEKIIGVELGFLLVLRVIGVGYKIEIQNPNLNEPKHLNQILFFKIGFSHDFKYVLPLSVKVFLLEQNYISIYGIDKNQVTQIAAKIREIKPPSPYKGKGIRVVNEKISLKQGKKK